MKESTQANQSSKALLDLESKVGNDSASSSSIESKLLCCKRDDFLKPRKPKSDKIGIPDQKPNISAVPESDVLGRVKNFLGVFAEANKKLQVDDDEEREKYDIETLTGNETELIEMDLMLGVADLHTPEAVAAAESAMAGYQPPASWVADDSSDDEDDDDTDDENVGNGDNDEETSKSNGVAEGCSNEAVEKQKPMKKKQKIVEL
ncbi:OLC1v1031568C1 [Oldenlandia corymbosa var. corymbosa]|uniref:OLC1v1031568C1 n=1 Tax=Oldenlandia corymbosa var. corymbosa TaxID=529605 RepID=A0AAV1CKN7_OLDCO|nr:OLC1v1031568C1 [Oldenlandia corymbosa var. corymbosa]